MLIEAKMLVSDQIALGFKKNPAHVDECRRAAEATMNRRAAERNRHISQRPELVDVRETGLGFVELIFQADTESD